MNLNVYTKNLIIEKALATQFGKEQETLKYREHVLAEQVYHTLVSKNLYALLEKIPSNWLSWKGRVYVALQSNGYKVPLNLQFSLPMPLLQWDEPLGYIGGELEKDIQIYLENAKTLTEKRKKAFDLLHATLQPLRTVKQLTEIWKEGEPFYREYIVPRNKSNLPMVQIQEINKALGI